MEGVASSYPNAIHENFCECLDDGVLEWESLKWYSSVLYYIYTVVVWTHIYAFKVCMPSLAPVGKHKIYILASREKLWKVLV